MVFPAKNDVEALVGNANVAACACPTVFVVASYWLLLVLTSILFLSAPLLILIPSLLLFLSAPGIVWLRPLLPWLGPPLSGGRCCSCAGGCVSLRSGGAAVSGCAGFGSSCWGGFASSR
jgi:hypothetical protein